MRYAGKEQCLAHREHSGKVWTKKTFSVTWAFFIIRCAPRNTCSRMFTLIPTLEEYLLRNSIKDLRVSWNQYLSYGRTWVVTWRENSICIVLYNSSSKFIAIPSFNQSTTTWERLFSFWSDGEIKVWICAQTYPKPHSSAPLTRHPTWGHALRFGKPCSSASRMRCFGRW